MLRNISKSLKKAVCNDYKFKPSFVNICSKNFSGGHHHVENLEDNYHDRKLNRISYNRKLGEAEREKYYLF